MASLQMSQVLIEHSGVPPQTAAERALAPPGPSSRPAAAPPDEAAQAGEFRFDVAVSSWSWSDELYAIHGFAPGEVVPSAELLLAHADPADRDQLAAEWGALSADGGSFCCRYRMFDAEHRPRAVVCRAEAVSDATGRTEIRGFLIDVTASERRTPLEPVPEAIVDTVSDGVRVEQAKGVLAAVYGLDPEQGLDLLRWHSAQGNVNVQVLAAGLIERLADRPLPDDSPRRALEAILSEVIGLPPDGPPLALLREPAPAQHLWNAVWAARACYDPRLLGHAEEMMARLYRPLARDLAMEQRRREVSLPVTFRAALSGLDQAIRGWQHPEIEGFGVFVSDQIVAEIGRTHEQLDRAGTRS